MTKTLWLVAALALAATPAFGQSISPDFEQNAGVSGDVAETDIYLRPTSGQSVEALNLSRALLEDLNQSRYLNRVDFADDKTLQLEAPMAMTTDAAGKTLTVAFELTPARSEPRSFSVSCRANRPDDCAQAVVTRAERFTRTLPRERGQ